MEMSGVTGNRLRGCHDALISILKANVEKHPACIGCDFGAAAGVNGEGPPAGIIMQQIAVSFFGSVAKRSH
jgi:hypothetical protein